MNLKITKEITLTADEIKDIIIRHLSVYHDLKGVFDINFKIGKKSYPSQYPQDCNYYEILTGATVRISENE